MSHIVPAKIAELEGYTPHLPLQSCWSVPFFFKTASRDPSSAAFSRVWAASLRKRSRSWPGISANFQLFCILGLTIPEISWNHDFYGDIWGDPVHLLFNQFVQTILGLDAHEPMDVHHSILCADGQQPKRLSVVHSESWIFVAIIFYVCTMFVWKMFVTTQILGVSIPCIELYTVPWNSPPRFFPFWGGWGHGSKFVTHGPPQIGALCFRTTSSAGPTHLEFSHTRYLCQLKSVLTSWPKDPSSFLLLFPSPSASIPRFLLLKAPLYLGSFGQMSQDSTFFSRMSYPSKTGCVLFNSHNF